MIDHRSSGSVQEKMLSHKTRNEKICEMYKAAEKEVTKIISDAKSEAY